MVLTFVVCLLSPNHTGWMVSLYGLTVTYLSNERLCHRHLGGSNSWWYNNVRRLSKFGLLSIPLIK